MATLTDIARETGYSVTAVSRVLNSTPGMKRKVSDETAAKIQAAARLLNYRPNRQASLMKKGKSAVILCFLPDVSYSLTADLMFGISEGACHESFSVNFLSGDSPEEFHRFLQEAEVSGNSGVLSYPPQRMPASLEQEMRDYMRHGGKMIFLNVTSNTPGYGEVPEEFSSVVQLNIDDYYGGVLSARHLLRCGCRRFIFFSRDEEHFFQRKEGFVRTVQAQGYPVELVSHLPLEGLQEDGVKTGIFAVHDIDAMQILLELGRHGITPGGNILLSGFDDLFLSRMMQPGLTSVRQPMRKMGKAAASKLIRMILGHEEQSEVIRPYLVVRESTGGTACGAREQLLYE